MDLKSNTEFTISDRMVSQLKNQTLIAELQERVLELEAEVNKYKTSLAVASDPETGIHEIKIKTNGVIKVVSFNASNLEYYVTQGDPVNSLLTDALPILTDPFCKMIREALREKVEEIFNNFKNSAKSSL